MLLQKTKKLYRLSRKFMMIFLVIYTKMDAPGWMPGAVAPSATHLYMPLSDSL